ncbi:MAG: hypothetical protein SCH10_01225 [Nitrosomonadaceae bacterium]|nr:hypothetical protein [Nitrosomonadaceae bacterium]
MNLRTTKQSSKVRGLSALLIPLLLVGCVTIPPNIFVATPQLLQQRQLETRRYDGITEVDLITAGANVLQDLGFNLENSETKLGVITASKQRDATHGGEIAAAIFFAVLTGAVMPTSKDQTIRVALVIRPVTDSNGSAMTDKYFVRATFQRVVRRTDNSVSSETLNDPQLYQDFFEKVSKSVFLEAQKI